MLRYDYISRDWIVSRTARRIYRGSAAVSLAVLFGWVIMLYQGWTSGIVGPPATLILFVGALGAGITLVGMEYFLFRFDDSHPLKQMFWFCAMLLPLLGAALYCFFVYSRAEVLMKSCTEKNQTASLSS
jgi:hypothetical protein